MKIEKVSKLNFFFVKNFNVLAFSIYILHIEKGVRPEVFCRKSVLENLARFKGKHLLSFWKDGVLDPPRWRNSLSVWLYMYQNNSKENDLE